MFALALINEENARLFLNPLTLTKLGIPIESTRSSDVVEEQKPGLGQVRGLLFGIGSGLGINISGTSSSGFWGFGGF